jgi:hypothetical protein
MYALEITMDKTGARTNMYLDAFRRLIALKPSTTKGMKKLMIESQTKGLK